MLDGVTPVPAEFAARYRALGYWEDRPLFDGFTAALAAHADRVAVIDEAGPVTYSDYPSLPYERILREWDELGYDQSVMDLVFHANAERILDL